MRRLPRPLPLVLLAAATASLAACAPAGIAPGVAAQVGEDTITVAQLQAEIDAVATVSPEGAPPPPETLADGQRVVLTREVQGLLVRGIAIEEGVEVAAAEIDQVLDQLREQSGGDLTELQQQNLYSDDGLRRAAEVQLLVQALQVEGVDVETAVEARAEEVGVAVNRRYGSWGGTSLVPGTGAIATAVATVAAG